MKLNRTSAVVEYKLLSQFQRLQSALTEPQYAEHLQRPLAFWALPGDRRLPLAFMGRTIGEIVQTPFEELYATPGVGQKKIRSLLQLLDRAVREEPVLDAEIEQPVEDLPPCTGDTGLDSTLVSEARWSQWRESIVRNGLEHEPLGRFATSLEDLPKVLWQTPLGVYTNLSLGEIRELKTHGEKRVAAILGVFSGLHALLSNLGPQRELAVRIVPRFVSRLESWLTSILNGTKLPDAAQLREQFIVPLMEQVRVDAGAQIAELTASRIGCSGNETSVRDSARRLGLTRARVYQMLADVGLIMHVRWPEGYALVHELQDQLRGGDQPAGELEAFFTTVELCFPHRRWNSAEETLTDTEADLTFPSQLRAG